MAKPEIRLKGFEREWVETIIGNIAYSRPSSLVQSNMESESGCYPVYGASGFITNVSFYHQKVPYIGVVKDGAGVGKIYVCPAFSSILGTLHYVFPKEKFDLFFLSLLLEKVDLSSFSTGSTIPHIYFSDYSSKEIFIPSEKEQKAISNYFSSLDTMIQSTIKKNESLKKMKQACLVSMFPQAGETTPRVRFKGFEGEWLHVELSECLSVCKDRNISESYNRNDVLSVSDDYGVVNQIELLGRSYAGKSVAPYRILRNGDIVYTKSPLKVKPFGIIKVNNGKDGIVSTLYAVYTPMDWVSSQYINYYFEPSFRMNKYIHPLVNKGAKNDMKVTDENVLKGKIYIPKDTAEQEKIASFFHRLDKQISLQEQKLEKLKQIKSACLDKMFV